MQSRNPLFNDLARVAEGALGAFGGVRHEVETMVRERVESLLGAMDLVRRDQFDAVKDVAAEARLRQEALEKQVAALEARVAALETKPKAPAKPRTRKTAAKTTTDKA